LKQVRAFFFSGFCTPLVAFQKRTPSDGFLVLEPSVSGPRSESLATVCDL